MKRQQLLIVTLTLLGPLFARAQDANPLNASQKQLFQSKKDLIFFIQRTKNANLVLYRGTGNGSVTGVNGEWLNLAEDGGRSDILFYEKPAYGYSVDGGPAAGTKKLTLNAVTSKPMTVKWDSSLNRPVAILPIQGKQARLVRIFVAHGTGFIPKVFHYDLYGYDVNTGQPVTERVLNN